MTRLSTAITSVTPRTKQSEEMSNVLTLSQFSPSPTSITATAQKRKANTKNDKGLKWFKGSPKKSNPKFRLLKSAQQEPAQLIVPTIAARVVEFDIDGSTERLGIMEPLPILEKGDNYSELLVDPNIKLQDELNKHSSPAFVGRKSKVKSDKVKVKSNKNGKVQPTSDGPEFSQPCLPLPEPSFQLLENVKELLPFNRPNSYIRYMEATQEELSDEVEYDLEEEDVQWLELFNAKRRKHGGVIVKRRVMEFLTDRLEKESYFQMQSSGMDHGPPIDDDAVCCICMDGECQNSNAILFCDMCNLAVHQDCYGVPYIPEGQWLCRKCLHSPSRAVECVLCPNKGGALKGTDDGRWAHVACAIWIPEVCFANTVFLEPIESIGNIPAARWRLTCFICKQKGIGACIQCYKSSCYTAFHVTCAQQANLVMKMETVREMHMTSVIIKKTAYCNNHAPPEMLLEKKLKDGKDLSSPRMKMKQTRKILAEKRDAIPAVLIPTIPRNRIAAISNSVNFPGKPAFMKRLMAYWKLKRQQRNGVPLLRRLQMASSAPNAKPSESKPKNRVEQQEQMDHYRSWVRLRQDLERARLLCEMIRKREKQKRELIYAKVRLAEMEIYPMRSFFLNIINEIIARDSREIFLYPVDVEEVTDYLTRVKEPMDLTTISAKVNSMEYSNVPSLESDFNLMINNCLLYNDKDTIYYKTALRIRSFGTILFRKAKKVFDTIGYDPSTGLHLSTRPSLTSISSTGDPISCKCNNTSNCNNNCKNNNILVTTPAPSIIPASFTTYRSGGGDGVGSESEGENDLSSRAKGNDGMGESESDSSSYSSYSSSGGSDSESGDEGRMKKVKIPPKVFPKSSESSESESEDDSSEDDGSEMEVRPSGGVTTRNNSTSNQDGVGTRRGRPRNNNKNSPKRASRSSNIQQQQQQQQQQHLNHRNGDSESDSDSSSSSSSSSSSTKKALVFRNKKLV